MSIETVLECTKRVVLESERPIGTEELGALKGVCEGILLDIPEPELIRLKIGEGAVELRDLSLDELYNIFFYTEECIYEAEGRIRERYRSEAGAVCEICLNSGLKISSRCE